MAGGAQLEKRVSIGRPRRPITLKRIRFEKSASLIPGATWVTERGATQTLARELIRDAITHSMSTRCISDNSPWTLPDSFQTLPHFWPI